MLKLLLYTFYREQELHSDEMFYALFLVIETGSIATILSKRYFVLSD